jgi:hypothetical protein
MGLKTWMENAITNELVVTFVCWFYSVIEIAERPLLREQNWSKSSHLLLTYHKSCKTGDFWNLCGYRTGFT